MERKPIPLGPFAVFIFAVLFALIAASATSLSARQPPLRTAALTIPAFHIPTPPADILPR